MKLNKDGKVELYAFKFENGNLLMCPRTGETVMAPTGFSFKRKIIKLRNLIAAEYPRAKEAKLIKLLEIE